MSKRSKGSRSSKLRLAHSGEPKREKETPRLRRKVEAPQTLNELCEQTLKPSAMARRALTPGELATIRTIFGPEAPIPTGGVAVSPVNSTRAELDPEQINGVWADILLKPKATAEQMLHEYAHWLAFWVFGPAAMDIPEKSHEEWANKVVGMYRSGQWFLVGHRAACQAHFLMSMRSRRA